MKADNRSQRNHVRGELRGILMTEETERKDFNSTSSNETRSQFLLSFSQTSSPVLSVMVVQSLRV